RLGLILALLHEGPELADGHLGRTDQERLRDSDLVLLFVVIAAVLVGRRAHRELPGPDRGQLHADGIGDVVRRLETGTCRGGSRTGWRCTGPVNECQSYRTQQASAEYWDQPAAARAFRRQARLAAQGAGDTSEGAGHGAC